MHPFAQTFAGSLACRPQVEQSSSRATYAAIRCANKNCAGDANELQLNLRIWIGVWSWEQSCKQDGIWMKGSRAALDSATNVAYCCQVIWYLASAAQVLFGRNDIRISIIQGKRMATLGIPMSQKFVACRMPTKRSECLGWWMPRFAALKWATANCVDLAWPNPVSPC